MELADILAKHAVLTCTGVTDKRQIFDILAQKAAELTAFPASQILSTLLGREELGSTGLGNGIAIPHGKLPELTRLYGIFARLDKPIDFDSIDDEPVDLIFLLLAPESAGADHLKALARVSRLLRDRTICSKLRGCDTADGLYAVLTQAPASHAA